MPNPMCECNKSKEYVVHLQKLKLFQFLMRLNGSYLQATSQILLMRHLPSINQSYSMVMYDESQKSVVATIGILGSNPNSVQQTYELAMYSRNGCTQKFKTNGNLYCDYCKLKKHTRDKYYKLIGYPQDFKFKKMEPNNAYNAMMEGGIGSQEQVHHKHLTTGHSAKLTANDYM